jgi:hypothetical protein
MGIQPYPVKKKTVEKPPRNSAGFCGGGQRLSWAVEPRKEERKLQQMPIPDIGEWCNRYDRYRHVQRVKRVTRHGEVMFSQRSNVILLIQLHTHFNA